MASVFDSRAVTAYFTLRLCALLRQRGVDVGLQQSIACLDAIFLHGILDEEDLTRIYRLTLINRKQDLWALQVAFDDLLKDLANPAGSDESIPEKPDQKPLPRRQRQSAQDPTGTLDDADAALMEGYSVREVDHHRDFRLIPRLEARAVLEELKKIARRHATIARRKFKRTNKHHGRLDLRSSVRQTLKYDGEILKWRFKRRHRNRSRFVVLSDVSGSMELYCIFLLNFLHQLNESRHMKVESFVFSTRLERLTREFRTKNFDDMLRKVADTFSGWSGGTKIGAAIEALNESFGAVVTPKTCVVIMSDGWDTGDAALLDREMDKLRRRAKSIIWINPLKGAAGYEPLAQGMATAAPYCDLVIAGHSLDSLDRLAGILGTA